MAYRRQSPQPVVEGGTGAQTLTAHGVLLGEGTSAVGVTAAGTTGQVLTGSTGADPVWASPAASSISITGNSGGALTGDAFTFTGGTTGLTFSGAGSTETLTGTLAIANGGTNATSMATTDGVVYYDGTRLVTTAVGTATQVLTSNGAGVAPTFQAVAGTTPGLVLIATKTASSSTSIAWTSGISATFNNYFIIYQGTISTSTSMNLDIQFSTNGGSSYTTSGYINIAVLSDTSGLVLYSSAAIGAELNITGNGYITNLTSGSGYISCFTSMHGFTVGGSPAVAGFTTSTSFYNTANVSGINALKLIASTGNFSGTFSLYSLQN